MFKINKKLNICILGTGFGGLYTLINLKKLTKNNPNISITLIDRKDYFLFTPLLHELATGEVQAESISYPIKKLKGLFDFDFLKTNIENIDFENKKVITTNKKVKYDYLVISLGSSINYYGLENIEQNSLTLKDINSALEIKSQLNMIIKKDKEQSISIIGGGSTGIELIGGINDYLKNAEKKVTLNLIEANKNLINEFNSEEMSEKAKKRIGNLKINLFLEHQAIDCNDGNISILDKTRNEVKNIKTDLLIWTAGVKPNQLIEKLSVKKDKSDRLLTDEYLNLIDFKNVYAIGDCATIIGKKNLTTAQVAGQKAEKVAENIAAKLDLFKYSSKFKYKHLGAMVTIGKNYGLNDLLGIKISGKSGWYIWKLVHVVKMFGGSNQIDIFRDWLKALYFKRYQ